MTRGAEEYTRLHWGHPGKRALSSAKAPDPSKGPIVVLGTLIEVVYRTAKDEGQVDYHHTFGNAKEDGDCKSCGRPIVKDFGGTKPLLAKNGENKLIVLGTSYTIKTGGITG